MSAEAVVGSGKCGAGPVDLVPGSPGRDASGPPPGVRCPSESEDPAPGAGQVGFGLVSPVYYARLTPGSIQVGVYRRDAEGGSRAVRGAVEGFSAGSRMRLLRRALSLPWEEAVGPGGIGMVTLTYPGVFSTDGRVVKRQLERLYGRLLRRYGVPKGMWKLEFQRRGAPHFHIFMGLPEDEEVFLAWLLEAWYESVASGDERHRREGVDISRWRWGTLGENRARVGEYFARHGAKGWESYQNELPEGYTSPGRWWGVWGGSVGFRPVEEELVFRSLAEYYEFRRLVWALQEKNRRRRPKKGGRDKGAWTQSADGLVTGERWMRSVG